MRRFGAIYKLLLNIDGSLLRRLASFEGKSVSEITSGISAVRGPIILAHHSPFPCALREGYSRGWGGGVNDQPDWESPIHVASSRKVPVLKVVVEKSRLRIKEIEKN
ncbi:hypothetical protein AVEN_159321-1 [Araneus ventricosus]|uniref:Uncharacterized protein n=1 Tax=Araneus ventricosus TaxID=182803 RepID=A0A4Y2A1L8_ARAVE|nr:hypothetical protein AVEN_159321-1 [Araneus ventricosus]